MNIFESPTIILDTEKDVICKFIANLGVRGSGKSTTSAVICEELLSAGVGMSIIDIDGEYWGLKEKYEILVVGGAYADIELKVEHAKIIAKTALEKNVSVIIDLSENTKEEMNEFLFDYLSELWEAEHILRRVHMLVLEEAHEFVPQGINSDLKEVITKIALRGRKRGLGAILVSQRSAKVDKNVLTQAEIFFLHKVSHPADFGIYAELTNMTKKAMSDELMSFEVGNVFFKYRDLTVKAKIRQRETFHAGFTPKLDGSIKTPSLKEVSKDLIDAFKSITEKSSSESSVIEKLEKKIKEKDSQIMEMEKRLDNLQTQLETVSRIKVELPSMQTIEKAIVKKLESTGLTIEPEKSEFPKTSSVTMTSFPDPYGKLVEKIKQIIARSNFIEIRMMDFLESRYPAKYTSQQISMWMGLSYSTIAGKPPKNLLQFKIMDRERGEKAEFWYRSNLKQFIEDQFEIYKPEISDDELENIRTHIAQYISYLAEDSSRLIVSSKKITLPSVKSKK